MAPTLPASCGELDAWLAEREAAVPGVLPHATKQVVWAAPDDPAPTELALVYLHGYSATRMETAPLPERLAQSLGANLFHTRLTGHGRDGAAMLEGSVDAWLEDAREAMAIGGLIGRRVLLIGTSTGGTLATLVATGEQAAQVAAMVLISPNFAPADPRAFLLAWPGARIWAAWIAGRERDAEPEVDGHARYWTTRYPTAALVPMMRLVRLAQRAPLQRLQAPTLVLFHPEDEVVDARVTRRLLEPLHPDPVVLETVQDTGDSSRHVIAGDVFSPQSTGPVHDRILRFLQERAML